MPLTPTPATPENIAAVQEPFRNVEGNLSDGTILYPGARVVAEILRAGATVQRAIAQFTQYLALFGGSVYDQFNFSHDRGNEAAAAFRQDRPMIGPNGPANYIPGGGGFSTGEAPSSNAIDTRTGKPFVTSYDYDEVKYRLGLTPPVGPAGNALVPDAVTRTEILLGNPPAVYADAPEGTLFLVAALDLDPTYQNEDYAKLKPEQLLKIQKKASAYGPSGR